MKNILLIAATAAIALLISGNSAKAGCYEPSGQSKPTVLPVMPKLPAGFPAAATPGSIVGLWHTTHTVGGQLFFESFEQWHSDGTEFEFANIPPASGDICLGAWTKTSKDVIELYHVGWTFDANGNSTGTLVLTATDKVSAKGDSFSGPFTAKFFDTKGKLLKELKGETTAVRIAAP